MSLREWALKPRELKALSLPARRLLAVRCAMRVEPWCPPKVGAPWRDGVKLALAGIDKTSSAKAAASLARALMDHGAIACNALEKTDEPLGRCMNYALSALASAVEATAIEDEKLLTSSVIDTAKLAASIPAVLAHAGRVRAKAGSSAVETACVAMWDEIRADVARIDRIDDPHAQLWTRRAPAWVPVRTR